MRVEPDGRPETPEEREARQSRRWRRVGLTAAVAAFLLISSVIAISTLAVAYGTRIYGDRHLVPGHRAAFRVAAYVLAAQDFAPGLEATLWLEGPSGKRVRLGGGASGGRGGVDVDARIPRWPPGAYTLVAEVTTPAGAKETARVPVTLAPAKAHPWLRTRNGCEEGSHPRSDGTWEGSVLCGRADPLARLYPEAGHLVGNLSNRVFAWVLGPPLGVTWQPLAARPAAGAQRPPAPAPPSPLRLDAFGLGTFDYVPAYPRGPLQITAGQRAEPLWLRALPSQIRLRATRALLGPGDRLDVTVSLLRGRVPLFLDLWTGGRWIATDSDVATGGAYRYTVDLPRSLAGFVALRAYTNTSGPTGTYDERVFWRSEDARTPAGLKALARAVAALPVAPGLSKAVPHPGPDPLFAAVVAAKPGTLDALGDAGREDVAAALLSRVEVVPEAAPPLADTSEAKIAAMEAHKRALRRPLLAGLALLGLGAVLAMIVALLGDRRGLRRRLAALEIDDQVLPEDEAEGAGPGRITAQGGLLLGLMLLALMGAAFAGLLTLLETLRW